MERVDTVIIGGGIMGLAVAYVLSKHRPEQSVLLLEKEARFGLGLSSRTSEVVHSGIYYPTGSLKARLCVEGNSLLYQFCREQQVPFQQLGKLIVAQNEADLLKLADLQQQGENNGVPDIQRLDRKQIADLEPALDVQSAIFCPSSGIVDSHRLMAKLEQGAKENGAMLVYQQEVTAIEQLKDGYCLEVSDTRGRIERIGSQVVINAAGLSADKIAAMAGIPIDEAGYRIYRCKGEYFAVHNQKASLINRLIFPVGIRELKGAGIPAIKDLKGRLRLGPDAHYASATATDYSVYPGNRNQFLTLVQGYLPFLEQDDLQPDLAGIRPRLLVPCGSPPRDFVICDESERGLPGLINLIGVESPGITCCLSLANYVGELLAAVP